MPTNDPDALLSSLRAAHPRGSSLRRPPREDVVLFRLRVDLEGFRPPVWRRLEVRSDTTLDVVHAVLQEAFGWWDAHLHRFALGDGVWDRDSELFLCPFDVEQGDDEGTPEQEVRLDETLQNPGDVLRYVYDYGDSWELTLKLEKVLLPAGDDAPIAACTGGRRAAPPEDSRFDALDGGLEAVVDDPEAFDLDAVNDALHAALSLRASSLHPALVTLVESTRHTPEGARLAARVEALARPEPPYTSAEKARALRAHLWFLERATGDGIELTSAGYLKPDDVVAASVVVPTMRDWIGTKNRESHSAPLLDFRELLQEMKLLRKYKGRLKLTRLAAAMGGDPEQVWQHLVAWLQPDESSRTHTDLTLLTLAHAATAGDDELPLGDVAALLNLRGYALADGSPLRAHHLLRMPGSAWEVLRDVGDPPPRAGASRGERLSPAARAMARDALLAAGR